MRPESGLDWLICSKFARQQPHSKTRNKDNMALTGLFVPCSLDSGLNPKHDPGGAGGAQPDREKGATAYCVMRDDEAIREVGASEVLE